jgi:hypothetical protein
MRRKLERALRTRPAPMGKDHRQVLEQRLLEEFDRQAPAPAPRPARWPRFAIAGLVMATLITASQAPAEIQLEVGKRVTMELSAEPTAIEALTQAVTEALGRRSQAGPIEVSARVRRQAGGTAVLMLDLWGDQLGTDAEIQQRVRELPSVTITRVQVVSVRGRIHDDLLGKLGYLLRRHASKEELELARQQAIEELRRREGDGVQVDVEIERDDAERRVRVKVKKSPPPQE